MSHNKKMILTLLCIISVTLVLQQSQGVYGFSRLSLASKTASRHIIANSNNVYSKGGSIIYSSNIIGNEIPLSMEAAVTQQKKRIGSEPEFALPDDSTIETLHQRLVLSMHFLITLANLYVSSTSIALQNPYDVVSLISVIISSILLGDFATGVFHWSVDNYGSIKSPVFGSVCVAFQGHHVSPWTITFRSFANNVYKICYATIPVLLLMFLIQSVSPLPRIFATLFINWWMLSQEFHKYSHMRSVPRGWKFLQDAGIIISKKEHGLHHTSPFEGNYCILTGICNPLLDKTKFFRYLERFVYKVTGNKPNTWLADPSLEAEY